MNYKQHFIVRLNAHVEHIKPHLTKTEAEYLTKATKRINSELLLTSSYQEIGQVLDVLSNEAKRDTRQFRKYIFSNSKQSYLLAFQLAYDIFIQEGKFYDL